MSQKLSVRSMVVAPPGKLLVSVDLSQAESWIVAHLAQDHNMINSLLYGEIHTDSASALFFDTNYCQHKWEDFEGGKKCIKCQLIIVKTARYIGKRYNHASSYQMKPPKAAAVINKDSDKPPYVTVTLAESKIYQERWHKRYPSVQGVWWPEIEYKLNSQGRTLTTTYGRRHTFFDQWGQELFRKATAFEPQSTVADHFNGKTHPRLGIEGGLRIVYKRLVKPYQDRKIINQSHDSCILECSKEDARDLGLEMQSIIRRPLVIKDVEFTIPVDGEIGERWGELEKIK